VKNSRIVRHADTAVTVGDLGGPAKRKLHVLIKDYNRFE